MLTLAAVFRSLTKWNLFCTPLAVSRRYFLLAVSSPSWVIDWEIQALSIWWLWSLGPQVLCVELAARGRVRVEKHTHFLTAMARSDTLLLLTFHWQAAVIWPQLGREGCREMLSLARQRLPSYSLILGWTTSHLCDSIPNSCIILQVWVRLLQCKQWG